MALRVKKNTESLNFWKILRRLSSKFLENPVQIVFSIIGSKDAHTDHDANIVIEDLKPGLRRPLIRYVLFCGVICGNSVFAVLSWHLINIGIESAPYPCYSVDIEHLGRILRKLKLVPKNTKNL